MSAAELAATQFRLADAQPAIARKSGFALVRFNEAADPMHVDYCNIGGAAKSDVQHGLFK